MSTPLVLVRDALWALLEADADFVAAVPARFRIKPSGTSIGNADTLNRMHGFAPWVEILVTDSKPQPDADSSAWRWEVTWAIVTKSNRQRTNQILDLQWYVYKAMKGWETYLKTAVTVGGLEIVNNCLPLETTAARKQLQNTEGWEVLWSCWTDLWFSRSIVA